ncbi:hypothetical protein CLV92_101288 [Kineococcus xinjiangensis]|uniref:Uncharacterized protein n=1 Tax=Kineococcus xinjiangensis TaxID=512762 RepID=A0A2S6IW49_9ACTN|nr:hypothetical protein CLV92_101288 [Kineococcus xinjiangensis]
MEEHSWHGRPPHDLGVIVHGPLILSRAPDIAAGLRAVVAYPSGLHLMLAYRAVGERANDARSWSYGRVRRYPGPTKDNPYSFPHLHVTVNDHAGPAHTRGAMHNSGDDAFSVDASYWIDELPRDGRVGIALEWPHAGLPLTETVLTLQDLDDLEDRVLRLV